MTGNVAGPTLQQWAAQCITLADALAMIDSLAEKLKEKDAMIANLGTRLAKAERKPGPLTPGGVGDFPTGEMIGGVGMGAGNGMTAATQAMPGETNVVAMPSQKGGKRSK